MYIKYLFIQDKSSDNLIVNITSKPEYFTTNDVSLTVFVLERFAKEAIENVKVAIQVAN